MKVLGVRMWKVGDEDKDLPEPWGCLARSVTLRSSTTRACPPARHAPFSSPAQWVSLAKTPRGEERAMVQVADQGIEWDE